MTNITIQDIANEAGVSKATVSRVLNNSQAVDPITRNRIQTIIEKRHFVPSATARNLSKRTSDTIGFVVPEIDNPFFGDILRGVIEIIDANNLTLICCNTDDNMDKDLKALEMLKEQRVRGLLYTPAIDYSTEEEKKRLGKILKEMQTPVVLMDRRISLADVGGVYFDDYHGMYNATKALIEHGHTKIAIINASLDRVLARDRRDGYMAALKDAGIEPDPRYNLEGNYRMTQAYELSKKLLAMEDRPTAVITCNNRTSLGFYKALRERGEKTPRDIALIGLDRIEELDVMGYEMNYIERDAKELGKRAIEMLINRMAFPGKAVRDVILDTHVKIYKI
ncbi:MAG: LacI family DNA-binding transcriptional regulator [Lachnospiraceae bacterium]|nr:LacI family DNA-binding transcriptional regulator [Lachnospiraceae bacterium]